MLPPRAPIARHPPPPDTWGRGPPPVDQRLVNFKPRPTNKHYRVFEGMTIWVAKSYGYGGDEAFYALLSEIRRRGGKTANDMNARTITHYVIDIPDAFEPGHVFAERDLDRDQGGSRKWRRIILDHAGYCHKSSSGTVDIDIERNRREGLTRTVVRREWLDAVLRGDLKLNEGDGLGPWGVWRESPCKVDAVPPARPSPAHAMSSTTTKIAIDPRRRRPGESSSGPAVPDVRSATFSATSEPRATSMVDEPTRSLSASTTEPQFKAMSALSPIKRPHLNDDYSKEQARLKAPRTREVRIDDSGHQAVPNKLGPASKSTSNSLSVSQGMLQQTKNVLPPSCNNGGSVAILTACDTKKTMASRPSSSDPRSASISSTSLVAVCFRPPTTSKSVTHDLTKVIDTDLLYCAALPGAADRLLDIVAASVDDKRD